MTPISSLSPQTSSTIHAIYYQDWERVGRAVLDAVMHEAKQRGAMQMVVVCGHLDAPKRKMLTEAGFTIASEWYVNTL